MFAISVEKSSQISLYSITKKLFNISVNLKEIKNADHIGETYNHMINLLSVYQISENKDDIQVVSQFPCFLGHPVGWCTNERLENKSCPLSIYVHIACFKLIFLRPWYYSVLCKLHTDLFQSFFKHHSSA